MLIKNNSIKLLILAMVFLFSGLIAEVSAQNSWLDAAKTPNWNKTVVAIPKTKKNSLQELSSNDSEREITVDEPKKYQISFKPDGELILISDCNRGGGKYEIEGNNLKISSTFLNLMSCGEDSLGSHFAQQLEGDRTFRIEDGNLIIEDADGTNLMKFIRARN